MYILVGARVRRDRRAGRWESTNVADVAVNTLRVTHGDVWLFITYPSQTEPQALRFDQVTHMVKGVSPGTTVQQWLTALGNQTLPFADTTPTFEPHYVKYVQAWHAGYNIESIPRLGQAPATGSEFDKTDLLITHPTVTNRYLAEHALVSVNGFFHVVDYNDAGMRVMGGNRSVRLANDNQIGIHSFAEVGRIQQVPIRPDMVYGQNSTAPLIDGAYLTIPDSVDVTNKTVLLVVGGYLQALGKTYQQVGDRTFKVALGKLMLLERYFDSYQKIDLSSLGLTHYDHNPSLLSTEEIQQDAVVRAYLTLEQSYFVVVDTPQMFHELDLLDNTGLPGRYIQHEPEYLPVVGAYGRVVEYHLTVDDGVPIIQGSVNVRHHYSHHQRKWTETQAVDSSRYPAAPFEHTNAFIRRLGCEK